MTNPPSSLDQPPVPEVDKLLDDFFAEAFTEAWKNGKGDKAKLKAKALITKLLVEARLDELNRMAIRTMDDPDDDTNVFWYRTYTMPEFEKRLAELSNQVAPAVGEEKE